MTCDFLSMEGCAMPQFAVFFTVARLSLSASKITGDFLFLTIGLSKGFLVSDGNIGRAMTKCVSVYWVQKVVLWLR